MTVSGTDEEGKGMRVVVLPTFCFWVALLNTSYPQAMRASPTLTPFIRVFEQAVWLLLECINLRRTIWGAQSRFTVGFTAVPEVLLLADVYIDNVSSKGKAKLKLVMR